MYNMFENRAIQMSIFIMRRFVFTLIFLVVSPTNRQPMKSFYKSLINQPNMICMTYMLNETNERLKDMEQNQF